MSFDLTPHNTLGLSAKADAGYIVTNEERLSALVAAGQFSSENTWVIGGGSNIVLAPKISGSFFLMRMRGISLVDSGGKSRDADVVLLNARAGENWHQLVRYSVAQGLSGMENLALIPGSVGAAPVQNIGAYGVELSDLLFELRALHRQSGEIRIFHNNECGFSYRDSMFKQSDSPWIILDITLALSAKPKFRLDYPDLVQEIERRRIVDVSSAQLLECIISIRRRKMPDLRSWGNVGSFFENPQVEKTVMQLVKSEIPEMPVYSVGNLYKISAAKLIDECGLKSLKVGAFAVWGRQPLVLINRGQGTYNQLRQLVRQIQQTVQTRFNIALKVEPRYLGST
ncbi:MAG: UDP-N-acetylmuramate dehydrogenase [Pseudomonadales bacterium]|nr:UDP-N-acetylmuramate dehydrogenase [Pseudomonadales bacterium]